MFYKRIILVVMVLVAQSLDIARCQLEADDIPANLRNLFTSDLDTWKSPEFIQKGFPYYLSGYDDENRPIWVVELGKQDFKTVLEKGGKDADDLSKNTDQFVYRILSSIGEKSPPQDPLKEVVLVVDMDGFTFDQLSSGAVINHHVRFIRKILNTFKFVHKGYIINANYFAQNLMNLMKPIFGREFERLEIYGTNPAKWKPVLLKNLPRDQLAEWYGGDKDFKPVRIYG